VGAKEVIVLDESTPQLVVPQVGDTYAMPRSVAVTGNITVSGTVDGRDVAADGGILDKAKIRVLGIACGDETTAITTGTGKAEFQIVDGAFTLTGVYATLTTAGTGSTISIDVMLNGTTIMTTNKISIEATEKTSDTATTAPGLTTTALAENSVIRIDFLAVDSGGVGAGPKVYLVGYWT